MVGSSYGRFTWYGTEERGVRKDRWSWQGATRRKRGGHGDRGFYEKHPDYMVRMPSLTAALE
jgi:hypothetical protein